MRVRFLQDVTLGAPAPERVLAGEERDLVDGTAQAMIDLRIASAVAVEPEGEQTVMVKPRRGKKAITELGPDGQPVDGG